jgi:hypothetical protein
VITSRQAVSTSAEPSGSIAGARELVIGLLSVLV